MNWGPIHVAPLSGGRRSVLVGSNMKKVGLVVQMYPGEFDSLVATQDGQVATIKRYGAAGLDPERAVAGDSFWEIGEIISRLRGRNDIRVVVLTGYADGVFMRPAPFNKYAGATGLSNNSTDPKKKWRNSVGISRALEGILTIEKPVIAKVNGDAIGFGQSMMFACDLIIACESARIIDHHLGNGEIGMGSPYGLVPGDGGTGLAPSYLSPALAKEYLMLGREFSAKELAALGVINYAVPASELDVCTAELVEQLLSRSAYALAWTKRAANKRLVEDFNLRHDLSAAYEAVSQYQAERLGWKNAESLD